MTNTPKTKFDTPWKDILETYFPDFIAFFFPETHRQINWTQGFEFLDKELQQVVRDAELGKRLVNKLVKIYRIGGKETWVLIHLEIQSQPETDFAERMFVYNYRIFDRYRRQVASLAVLGDENLTWRPQQFGYQLFGTEVNFRYPIVKLLDLKQQWSELEANQNPFAIVVMAHLKALETRRNRKKRKEWKLILTKSLYEKNYTRENIINLFRFIDWVMSLPKELENEFWTEITNFEEEKRMPYITSVERRGIEIGLSQGLEQGLSQGLEREKDLVIRQLKRKLGEFNPELETQIRSLEIEQIEVLGEALLDFISVEDLRLWLSNQQN